METTYETNSNVHYLTTEDKKHLSSKAVGGTALGLGIAGTALGILNGGAGIFNTFSGNSNTGSGMGFAGAATLANVAAEEKYLERKETADYIQITKDYYENKLASLRELTESFYTLDQKIQAAKDVAATQSRENFDALNKRIIDLEKASAVQQATQPLYNQISDLKLNYASQAAQHGIMDANMHAKNMVDGLAMQTKSMVEFEAERRRCGDNTIVNYCNSTFYPHLISGLEISYTSAFQPIYNPLMPPVPQV